jgi:hypothetical protein
MTLGRLWERALWPSVAENTYLRELPRPLKIPTVMTLNTLADMRERVERHLPAGCRERETWRRVAERMNHAARGGDIGETVIALRLVLQLERRATAVEILNRRLARGEIAEKPTGDVRQTAALQRRKSC